MILRRTKWICFLALGILPLDIGIALPAKTQDYPTQTLKIIVPFVAGGGVDVVARIVAPKLSKELGQSVIIENRGGAGGALGATAVAQAPADGYTLLVGTGSTHGTNSNVYARLSYDPVRDFVPVVLLSSSPLLLIVPQASPARNVGELIALGRRRPGELSFGSYGTGSINHLGAELFNSMAKIQADHVPYRGSASLRNLQPNVGFHCDTALPYKGVYSLTTHSRQRRCSTVATSPLAVRPLRSFRKCLWSNSTAPKSSLR